MSTSKYSADLRQAIVAAHNDVLSSEIQAQSSANVAFATVTHAFEDRQVAVAGLSDARSLLQLSTLIDEQAEWYKLTAQNILALGQASAAKGATAAAQASAAATAAKQAADALGNLTDKLGAICNRTDGIGGSIDDQARAANEKTKTGAEAAQKAKFAAMTLSVSAAESKAPAVVATLQTLLDEFTGLAASAKTTLTSNQTRTATARKQLSDTLTAEAKASLAYAQSQSDFRARERTLTQVDSVVNAPTARSSDKQIQATVMNVPTSTTGVTFVALEWSEAQQFTYRDFVKLPRPPAANAAPPSTTGSSQGTLATVAGTKNEQTPSTYTAILANDAWGDPLMLGATYCVFAARSVDPIDIESGQDTLLSCPSDPVVVRVGLTWPAGGSAPKVSTDSSLQFTITEKPTVASPPTTANAATAPAIQYRILIVPVEVYKDYLKKHKAEEMSLVSQLNPAYYCVWQADKDKVTFDPTKPVPAYVDIFGEPIDLTAGAYVALVLAVAPVKITASTSVAEEPERLLSDASDPFPTPATPAAAAAEPETHEEEI